MIYAVIEDGWVINAVEWDGATAYAPPRGEVVAIEGDWRVGWRWDGQAWRAPDQAPAPQPPRP